MTFFDYHTHNRLCNHALGNQESYVKAAIKQNLSEIGFSDHFPWDIYPKIPPIIRHQWFITRFAMTLKKFPKYIEKAKILREKYKDSIKIKIASEIDFVPETFEILEKALEPFMCDFDYLIGSVHIIKFKGDERWILDSPKTPAMIKKYGHEKICIEYFDTLIKMVKTGYFDIVGHFDLQKARIKADYSDASWQKLLDLLDTINARDMAVEINTSGIRKIPQEQYPSHTIVKELVKREIPITLGSDAHKPSQVGYKFKETIAQAKKLGVTHLCTYTKRNKSLVKLE